MPNIIVDGQIFLIDEGEIFTYAFDNFSSSGLSRRVLLLEIYLKYLMIDV